VDCFKLELAKSVDHPVKVGLGTDVGGGTSFSSSKLRMRLQGSATPASEVISIQSPLLATLGRARAILADEIGNFDVGKKQISLS